MTEYTEKISRFMVHSDVGKKMVAEAFYKAIFVLKKQRFPNKLLINELEILLDSDVYRDILSTEQKEWDDDLIYIEKNKTPHKL